MLATIRGVYGSPGLQGTRVKGHAAPPVCDDPVRQAGTGRQAVFPV